MLNSPDTYRQGNSTASSSSIPSQPLPLLLENIGLENQTHSHFTEVIKLLRFHHFEVQRSKPTPPLAAEKLNKIRESVQDTLNKARDREKLLQRFVFKLDCYNEDLATKKRDQTELCDERWGMMNKCQENTLKGGGLMCSLRGHPPPDAKTECNNLEMKMCQANILKMDGQVICNPHDHPTEKPVSKTKCNEVEINKHPTIILKMGGQVICNPRAHPPESLDAKAKRNGLGMNKRPFASKLDLKADGRSADSPEQLINMEIDRDMVTSMGKNAINIEEKIPRLPAGGFGWDKKLKRKRSSGVAGNRGSIGGESAVKGIKQAVHGNLSFEPNFGQFEAQGCSLQISPQVLPFSESLLPTKSGYTASLMGLEGVLPLRERNAITEERTVAKRRKETNIHEIHAGTRIGNTVKGKISWTPRTFSGAMSTPSPGVCNSSETDVGRAKDSNTSKSMPLRVANNVEQPMSKATSASIMSHWVGHGPLPMLLANRLDLVSLSSNSNEARIPSEVFATPGLTTTFSGTSQKLGARRNQPQERFGISEAAVTSSDKAGSSTLPKMKNKILERVKSIDRLAGQRMIGRMLNSKEFSATPGEKMGNSPAPIPVQSVRQGVVTNRSILDPLPSKMPTVCQNMLNGGPPDHAGELGDYHEELLVAATYARDARYQACRNALWKKMECYFSPITSQDEEYLKDKLNFVEQLTGILCQNPRDEIFDSGNLILRQDAISSTGETETQANQDYVKTSGASLYQRLLSAMIVEQESGELNYEGKNNFRYASDNSHCGSCNYNNSEYKNKNRTESDIESEVLVCAPKRGWVDTISCDKSVSPNTDSNGSVSSSVCNNEPWQADDGVSYSYAEFSHVIHQNDLGLPQSPIADASPVSCSENQYQMMSPNERLLLEVQYLGLDLETTPQSPAEESPIDQDIAELEEGLFQQAEIIKRGLGNILEAISTVMDAERRNLEEVALSRLAELATRRRMVSRANPLNKVIRRVSNKVASGFVESTLYRYREFEATGKSCFSAAPLQDVIFSESPYEFDIKSVDCVGSGTASNRSKRSRKHMTELKVSGSSRKQKDVSTLHEPVLKQRKTKEVLLVHVGRSASSSRTENQNMAMVTNSSSNGNSSSSTSTCHRKTKPKFKLNASFVLESGAEPHNCVTELAHPGSTSAFASSSSKTIANRPNRINRSSELSKEKTNQEEKGQDLPNLSTEQLTALGLLENEDLMDFDEDGMHEQDLQGLEIPMDDLSDIQMLI